MSRPRAQKFERSMAGFRKVTRENFIKRTLEINPGMTREELTEGLDCAIEAFQNGRRCDCGNPIWIAGASLMGLSCFTCITGEAMPDDDSEIDIAWTALH